MSELLIQYQTFAQNKQLCYSQKRGGLNFPQRFWSVTMGWQMGWQMGPNEKCNFYENGSGI